MYLLVSLPTPSFPPLVSETLELFSIVQCLEDGPIVKAVLAAGGNVYPGLHLCPHSLSHSWLFPQCLAVIHHGGTGTVFSAIMAGVPQVCILPQQK